MNTPHITRLKTRRAGIILSIALLITQLGVLTIAPLLSIEHAYAATGDNLAPQAALSDQPANADLQSVIVHQSMAQAEVTAGDSISGLVFQDNNNNGVDDGAFEAGFANIQVKAFAANGALAGEATTDGAGNYSITTTLDGPYRVELGTLPNGLYDSAQGATSATSVRFVAAGGDSNLNFGVSYPAAYCEDSPNIVTNLFYQDSVVGGQSSSVENAVTGFPYSSIDNVYVKRTLTIQQQQVGSTWGLAYSRSSKALYAASYFKRYAPVGPAGLGAIYSIAPASDPASVATYANLDSLFGTGTTGPNLHNFAFTADYTELPAGVVTNTFDAVGKVGLGDLDINDDESRLYTINLFDRKLYEIPLDQTPTAANVRSTAVPLDQDSLASNACPDPSASIRPFALKYYQGAIYVGMVCNGEGAPDSGEQSTWTDSNGDGYFTYGEPFTDTNGNGQFDYDFPDGLFAYVYRVDPATLSFEATPAFSMSLAFNRGEVNGKFGLGDWAPWARTPNARMHTLITYPQPILSDIEFDSGNMVLGFRDRFGDQAGDRVQFFGNQSTVYRASNGGDVLRACGNAVDGWELENNGICGGVTGAGSNNQQGPGGGEYYQDLFNQLLPGDTDGIPNHQETILGGLAIHSGRGELLATAFDPSNFYAQGVRWLNNANGQQVKSYDVMVDSGTGFGKGAGIGDVEILCSPAPLEIGNRIWLDQNQNGIQDPGEAPISGVTVRLYASDGTLAGTAVTNSEGQYYFAQRPDLAADDTLTDEIGYVQGGLLPNSQYQIRLDNAADFTSVLAALKLTRADATNVAGGSDLSDSDAQLVEATSGNVGTWPTILVTTGSAGANNHSLDVGFHEDVALSVGNQLWYDVNNNGQIDANESGISGVKVDLFYDANGDGTLSGSEETPIQSSVTLTDGFYLFTQGIDGAALLPGKYAVGINPANFAATGVLAGMLSSGTSFNADGSSSETAPADPNNAADNDDSGAKQAAGFYANGVLSAIFDLTVPAPTLETSANAQGTQPAGQTPFWQDPNPDASSNLTIDFGFWQPFSLGNRVWLDSNDNGLIDSGEAGISGVEVSLYSATGTTALATQTTDANGYYRFDNLLAGEYRVVIAASNFATGALAGMRSSTPDEALPDSNGDSNDNGVGTISDPTSGISSGVVTLGPDGSEPPNEGDLSSTGQGSADAFANMTVDFGFWQPFSLGNRVWLDSNNNGLIDSGEAGISGVEVSLYTATGTTALATQSTDANGYYRFDNLLAGEYRVVIAASNFATGTLAGMRSSTPDEALPDSNGDSNDNGVGTISDPTNGISSGVVTLGADGSEPLNEGDLSPTGQGSLDAFANMTVDFGFWQPLSLGNRVWLDGNNDGTINNGETGIAGVQVALYTITGTTALAIQSTDANGYYRFDNLLPGEYRVVIAASNFAQSGALAGMDSSKPDEALPDNNGDSNDNGVGSIVDITKGVSSGVVTLRADGSEPLNEGDLSSTGQGTADAYANMTVDFGFYTPEAAIEPLALGDMIWFDTNDNGRFDASEQPVAGLPLVLWTVDATGKPLQAVMTTTTQGNGCYLFLNLAPNDYVVQIPADQLAATGWLYGYLPSDPRDSNPSNAVNDNTGALSGTLGILSAKMTLNYTTQPLNEATCALPSGYNDNNVNQTIDIGLYKLELGNRVWVDSNANGLLDNSEAGLDGMKVELLDSTGTVIMTQNTQSGGYYSFTGLMSGTYSVRITAPVDYVSSAVDGSNPNGNVDSDDNGIGESGGKIQSMQITLTPGNETSSTASDGKTVNDTLDFGLVPLAAIGDYTWLDVNGNGIQETGEQPLAGVTVTLLLNGTAISTTVSDAAGLYKFEHLAPGDYSLQFTAPITYLVTMQDEGSNDALDSDINPVSGKTITTTLTPGEADMSWDAGFTYPASIGNYVWFDEDKDGVYDANESPLAQINVTLYITRDGQSVVVATQKTNKQGEFFFGNLPPGSYWLEFDASGPAEYTVPGLDSDVDPATGKTGVVSLAPGEYKILGAGYISAPSIHFPSVDEETEEPAGTRQIYLPVISNN